jgi:hypothetical protein
LWHSARWPYGVSIQKSNPSATATKQNTEKRRLSPFTSSFFFPFFLQKNKGLWDPENIYIDI